MSVVNPREHHKEFERLWNAGDSDGLVQLYEEGAVYVPVAGQTLTGHTEIRAMLEQVTAAGLKNRLELLNLVELDDLALERTRWTMTLPDGAEQSGLSNVVLRRQADRTWRMIIDDPGLTE
jgi:uncharacterized protein (TIGR02246 family)